MADEYESVSDYIANLDKFDRKLRRDNHRFSPEQRADFVKLNRNAADYLKSINEALRTGNTNVVTKTDAASKRVRDEVKLLRRKHLEALSEGNIAPVVSVAYLASLNAFSRVRDHSQNIAEAIAGEK